MPPSHKPAPAPPPADDTEPIQLDAEVIELDAGLLVPDEPQADDLPAGLGWHVSRQWARVRPHARSLAYATARALSALGRWTARAAAGARPLARRLWRQRIWLRQIWQ